MSRLLNICVIINISRFHIAVSSNFLTGGTVDQFRIALRKTPAFASFCERFNDETNVPTSSKRRFAQLGTCEVVRLDRLSEQLRETKRKEHLAVLRFRFSKWEPLRNSRVPAVIALLTCKGTFRGLHPLPGRIETCPTERRISSRPHSFWKRRTQRSPLKIIRNKNGLERVRSNRNYFRGKLERRSNPFRQERLEILYKVLGCRA